jgi:hypothetical protein
MLGALSGGDSPESRRNQEAVFFAAIWNMSRLMRAVWLAYSVPNLSLRLEEVGLVEIVACMHACGSVQR